MTLRDLGLGLWTGTGTGLIPFGHGLMEVPGIMRNKEKDIEKNRDGEWVTIFLGSKKWKSVSLDWKGNYLCQYTL